MKVQGYEITTAAFYRRGRRNLQVFQDTARVDHLFYAALEFRNAIERLAFEHLYLLDPDAWEEKWEKLYRVRELRKTILSIEPEFDEKLEFMAAYLEALGAPAPERSFDLVTWNSSYGRLGSFLHAPKRPDKSAEDPEWWRKLLDLVTQVDQDLQSVLAKPIGFMKLSEEGVQLYEEWKGGQMSSGLLRHRVLSRLNEGSG